MTCMGTSMSDDNVIPFNSDVTFNDIDPKDMVKNAMDEYHWQHVILVGWTGEDNFTVCSSTGNTADIVYSLELAKKTIIETANG